MKNNSAVKYKVGQPKHNMDKGSTLAVNSLLNTFAPEGYVQDKEVKSLLTSQINAFSKAWLNKVREEVNRIVKEKMSYSTQNRIEFATVKTKPYCIEFSMYGKGSSCGYGVNRGHGTFRSIRELIKIEIPESIKDIEYGMLKYTFTA